MNKKSTSDKNRPSPVNVWGKVAFGIAMVCVMLVRWSTLFDLHSFSDSGMCADPSQARSVNCDAVSVFGFARNFGDVLFALVILGLIQSGRRYFDRLAHGKVAFGVGAIFWSLAGLLLFMIMLVNLRYSTH